MTDIVKKATGEVARVLNLHASFKASAEIQDPDARWYWECDGCDIRLALSGTYGRPEVVAALAAHQAAMLAEAGLLRDTARDHCDSGRWTSADATLTDEES